MRVFITGATGFIGSAVIAELIAAGHQALGLARSEAGAAALADIGAKVHRGSLEDLDSLASGAKSADGVIHLAFNHDFSKLEENCETDRRAIEALGGALAGSGRPFLVTSGTAVAFTPGRLSTEDDAPNAPFPRVASEHAALALAKQGVRVSVVRLPQVHDPEKQGLISYLIATARERGVSAYVGDGRNRWPAAHRLDVARLYRLALEKGVGGRPLQRRRGRRRAASRDRRGHRPRPQAPCGLNRRRGGGRALRLARGVRIRRHPGVQRADAGAAGLASDRPRSDVRSRQGAGFRSLTGFWGALLLPQGGRRQPSRQRGADEGGAGARGA